MHAGRVCALRRTAGAAVSGVPARLPVPQQDHDSLPQLRPDDGGHALCLQPRTHRGAGNGAAIRMALPAEPCADCMRRRSAARHAHRPTPPAPPATPRPAPGQTVQQEERRVGLRRGEGLLGCSAGQLGLQKRAARGSERAAPCPTPLRRCYTSWRRCSAPSGAAPCRPWPSRSWWVAGLLAGSLAGLLAGLPARQLGRPQLEAALTAVGCPALPHGRHPLRCCPPNPNPRAARHLCPAVVQLQPGAARPGGGAAAPQAGAAAQHRRGEPWAAVWRQPAHARQLRARRPPARRAAARPPAPNPSASLRQPLLPQATRYPGALPPLPRRCWAWSMCGAT